MKQLLLLLLLPITVLAQPKLSDFKSYPFSTELCSNASKSKIAWAMDEQGKRNIYVAEAPDFKPRKLTDFSKDDGQEITSLSISNDGNWVVFVRGGDHGANWDIGLPLNPTFELSAFKVQVASVPFAGGAIKYLSEGDAPQVSPDSKTVAFIKSSQVWMASIDGSVTAKNLFITRGNVNSLQWDNDGKKLLFVANRTDHSIIGIYTVGENNLQWVAPSFNRDAVPQWSEDGNKIAFVRRPPTGGTPDSILTRKHQPWSICVADVNTNKVTTIYTAPKTLRGSVPSTQGGYNLHWAANNTITFLSYEDGWPHLYSLNANGGKALLLTPGNFMCEHISLSANKKYLTFSANAGKDALDIERRHAVKVSVDKADMQVLTPGNGNEWAPVMVNENTIAFVSANAQRPPLPALINLNDSKIKLIGEAFIPSNFPQQQLVTPTQVIFKSSDGVTVHADLFMPKNVTGKIPAIVYIHGGPPRQMLLGFHYSDYYSNAYASNQYLANLGFAVLSVNYRLGIGYGYEFHQPAKSGTAGASEYLDIKAAGEWLQKQNFVDIHKIGVYGGSYGGFLTAMALAKDSKIFAAGVDIHGVHNWVDRGGGMAGMYNNVYEKAPDFQLALKTAWESSPVSAIKTWKSPVLIIHGDDDRNVQFNQSIDLIARLEKQGVPYETLMIVDDTHHWMSWHNAVTAYGAVADYFVKKLKK
jgi:dipeptidyl aminopeptidase/acylaminoacyl peptidase